NIIFTVWEWPIFCVYNNTFMGSCVSSAISKQFVFVKEAKTFSDAQMYCGRFHGDLASVDDAADSSRLQAAVSGITDPSAWIGLKRGEPDWFWSLSDSTFYGEGEAEYRCWKTGQLDNAGGSENCGAVDDAGEFWDVSCASHYTFICYDGEDTVSSLTVCASVSISLYASPKI
uniref:C-type lectin domain-containing protein n=1 Tax=Sinocyclocheilus rhinocerous TaxID=307959 RepID=A0A673HMU4_9TELE